MEDRRYIVLVVEDNPGDFMLINDFLEDELKNLMVYRAESFSEAGKLLKDIENPDVILLDLSLPDRSGETLVLQMLEIAGAVPVIVLTGFSDKEFSIKSLSLGVSDYLLKDELSSSSLLKSMLYSIERKAFINKLEHSEQRYRDLFRLSPQPMFICEFETYRILNVNEATVIKYGYKFEEFLEMDLLSFYQADTADYSADHEGEQSNIEKPGCNQFLKHKTKKGEIIYVDIQSNNVFFNEKKALLIIASDVTERINYITKIEQQNKKLSDIAWIQSHILRAPLVRMMGLIQLIEEENFEVSDKEVIYNLKSSCYELDGIVRDILTKADRIKTAQNNE